MGFKLPYNSSEVDRSGGGDREQPPVNVYTVKVREVQYEEEKSRIIIISEINEGSYKGHRYWDYIAVGDHDKNPSAKAQAWRLDAWLRACGIDTEKKEKGTFDTDKLVNSLVKVRTKMEKYGEEDRSKIAAVLGAAGKEAEPFPEEEPEDEDVEAEEVEAEESEDGEEDLEALGSAADEGDEDAAARLTELCQAVDVDPDDYATWAEVAELLTNMEEPEAEEAEEDEADAASDDYNDWDEDALRAELKRRGLATKGPKKALVSRLEADDEEPFS